MAADGYLMLDARWLHKVTHNPKMGADIGGKMAKAITLDLHARRIENDASIWIVHSGRNSQLLDFFESNNLVLLEYPGLDLRPQIVSDEAAIRQRLRRSQVIRANKGLTRQDGTPILLQQFPDNPDKDVAVALRTVLHLTTRMKSGDLVIAPGKGSQSRVLFGEVNGAFDPNLSVRSPGITYADVPARSVRWLNTKRLKRDLPPSLQRYFEKPPAIARVARDQFSERFYDHAYRSYIKQDTSWAVIDAPTYDGTDLRATIEPTSLVVFAVSLLCAEESGDDYSGLSYDQIVAKYYDVENFYKLAVSYSSPGEYPAKAKDAVRALALAGIIALAAAGGLSGCKGPQAGVVVINSEAPADVTNPVVQRMINRAVDGAGGAALAEADAKGVRAHNSVSLTAPPEVKR